MMVCDAAGIVECQNCMYLISSHFFSPLFLSLSLSLVMYLPLSLCLSSSYFGYSINRFTRSGLQIVIPTIITDSFVKISVDGEIWYVPPSSSPLFFILLDILYLFILFIFLAYSIYLSYFILLC